MSRRGLLSTMHLTCFASCVRVGLAAQPRRPFTAARGGSSPRGRGGYRPPSDDYYSPPRGRSGDAVPSPDPYAGFEYVYGVSPVVAALRARRREPNRLLLQDSLCMAKRKDAAAIDELQRLAAEAGLPVVRTDKGFLNNRCLNRPHQGVVLETGPLDFVPLGALPAAATAAPGAVWLALDEVSDPQNLGALLRTALFLGVDGVLVSEKNSCPLTPAVSKASAGAMEQLPVHCARNLVRALDAAREDGWQVVGAALDKRSVEPADLDAGAPTVLVLGSEGHGLRTNVLRACSGLVRIPRGPAAATEGAAAAAGDAELVDSLNVSVAGGILLWSLLAARRGGNI